MYEKGTLELWAKETLEVARHFKRKFTALYWEWIIQVHRDIFLRHEHEFHFYVSRTATKL